MSALSDQVKELDRAVAGLRAENYEPAAMRRRSEQIRRDVTRVGRKRISVTLGDVTVASASGAPTDADYLVKTANGSLSAERVVTDTATVTWDWATGGQAKANAVCYPSWTVVTKTGAYSAALGDFVNANVTSASFDVTLPTAVGNSGKPVAVRRTDASGNTLRTIGTGGQTINGGASHTIASQFDTYTYVSDGANWMVT